MRASPEHPTCTASRLLSFSLGTCSAPHRFQIPCTPNEVKNNKKSLFQINNNHSSTLNTPSTNWNEGVILIEKREQMLFNEICWKTRVNLWNLHHNILVPLSFQTETAIRGQKVIERDFTFSNSFGGRLIFFCRQTFIQKKKRKITTKIISLKDKRLVAAVCARSNPNNENTNNKNNNKFSLIRNAKSKCKNSRRSGLWTKKNMWKI